MWIARRIFLKESGLSDTQKFQLMNNALLDIVFPFIESKEEGKIITGWYFSRKWEYSDTKGLWNLSVRLYVEVVEEFLEMIEEDLHRLVDSHSSILSIQNEPVDEKLKTLPFILRACRIAKEIIQEYPEWDRRFNRHCFNKVGYEIQELIKSMPEFDTEQINQVAHFILFNTHLLEYPDGSLAEWNMNSNRKYQFAPRLVSVLDRFQ